MKRVQYIYVMVWMLLTATVVHAQTQVVDAGVYENISKTFTLHEDGGQELRVFVKLRYNTYDSFNRFYGETFILYNSEYQSLKINKSTTIMADGKVIETPPNAFNEVLPSFAAKAPAYNHLKEMVVTHTGLEIGATIELDYTITTKPGFYPSFDNTVTFAEDIPVKDYRVSVRIPSGTQMGHGMSISILPEPKPTEEDGLNIYTWSAKDLPAMPKESFMPAPEEMLPVLVFSTTRDFQSLFAGLGNQAALRDNEQLPASAVKFVDGIVRDNRLEIMQILKIQEYVINNVNTIRIPDALLGYRYAEPQDVWQRNYGTVGEKTILLAALLRHAGIQASPSFVASDKLYNVGVASASIFNDWVVKITLADNRPMYLSAVKQTNINMKYKYLENHIVRSFDLEGKSLRSDLFSSVSPNNLLSGFMTMDMDNNLMGHFELRLEDSMNPYLDLEKDINNVKKVISSIPEKTITGAKKPKVAEDKTEVTLDFTNPDAWTQKGDYYFMGIPEFKSTIAATDFGPLPNKRDAPFVVQKFKTTTSLKLILPEGYVLVAPVVEKESRKSFGHYKIEIKQAGNTVSINRQVEITESAILPIHYDVFRAFITEWNDAAYRQLIIRKK